MGDRKNECLNVTSRVLISLSLFYIETHMIHAGKNKRAKSERRGCDIDNSLKFNQISMNLVKFVG